MVSSVQARQIINDPTIYFLDELNDNFPTGSSSLNAITFEVEKIRDRVMSLVAKQIDGCQRARDSVDTALGLADCSSCCLTAMAHHTTEFRESMLISDQVPQAYIKLAQSMRVRKDLYKCLHNLNLFNL